MSRVISIVTLYYPKYKHIQNIKNIAKQSDFIAICDNSTVSNKVDCSCIANARYFHNGKNNGLSKAFNIVLKDSSFDWNDDDYIIFFDQDSQIPSKHVEMLIAEYERLKGNSIEVGCLGPVYYDTSYGKEMLPRHFLKLNDRTMIVTSIVTTSLLCKYGDLKKVNFWNENIFLDLADWDLCWRMASHNMHICLTKESIIKHSVGCGNKKIGPFSLRVGSPFREYYQTRDCIYLLMKKYTPLKYKVRFFAMLTIRPLLHFVFLDRGWIRLKYVIKGICDYFRGVNGALQ